MYINNNIIKILNYTIIIDIFKKVLNQKLKINRILSFIKCTIKILLIIMNFNIYFKIKIFINY